MDVLAFYEPGAVEASWTAASGSLTVLSLALPARASRITNIDVAALFVIVWTSNASGEKWVWFFSFAAIFESTLLVLVIRRTVTWPRAVASR